MDKQELMKEFYRHLSEDIIPFWAGLKDEENGGFYGLVDFDHNLDKKADKGCILNSRILWFFSTSKLLFDEMKEKAGIGMNDPGSHGQESATASYEELAALCTDRAKHAYDFLINSFLDKQNGGVFWAVTYDGKPADTLKHTYCHAFAIYALAAYFDASGDRKAFDTAMELADLIEKKCTDDVGYLEAFNRDFTPARNDELSENGVMADKTMNTLLHVFEAYTELLRVIKKHFPAIVKPVSAVNSGNTQDTGNTAGAGTKGGYSKENAEMAEKIANRMRFILDIFAEKIYNTKLRRQEVFFDREYKPIIDLHSYGHDIETSWLMDRGLEVLADVEYTNEIEPLTLSLAERIYERAYVEHSLLNECEKGVDDKRRIWWVQAETVIGFMHASQKILRKKDRVNLTMKAAGASAVERQQTAVEAEKRSANFFMGMVDVWEFIKDRQIDRRSVGSENEYRASGRGNDNDHIPAEWYSELTGEFQPIKTKNLVDPWKCPYHNGRMCIEMIRRLGM
ncbi:MAG: AGE family epimerase/isomerase [Lachnospiraceae bacterium]|nr:AGE family epimerase/isomerase [Lachnospiraceae bacterium]